MRFPPRVAMIDPRAHREDLAHHPARLATLGPPANIIIEKREARGAAEKASDTAVQMHQIADPAFARNTAVSAIAAEVFQIDEPDAEAARAVVGDHHVGLLQIARVDACVVHPLDLARDRREDSPPSPRVASFDPAGAEREPRQAVGLEKRLRDQIRCAHRAAAYLVHRGDRRGMRNARRRENLRTSDRARRTRSRATRREPLRP